LKLIDGILELNNYQNIKGLNMMESKLFTYAGGNDSNDNNEQFFDCTLMQDIGSYEKGSKIECIAINYSNGDMEFWTIEGKQLASFKVELRLRLGG
jgi:hypothetical protein